MDDATVMDASCLDLNALRQRVDVLDSKLVNLLNERATVSINIGLAKRKAAADGSEKQSPILGQDDQIPGEDAHVHIPSREKAVYDRAKQLNRGPLTNEAIHAIYREIMSASISLQKEISIAYLGPPGTYSHQASFNRFGESVSYSSQATIADVFKAVQSRMTTYGVIPFENSTFGSVQQTLDSFIHLSQGIKIRADMFLPIHHCLLSNSSSLATIKRVYTHPEAFGQCQKWLSLNLKHAERVSVSSTSYAAELASKETDSAAVCSQVCTDIYGLKILAKDIEDSRENTTRFFILGDKFEAATGNDRTLISFTVDHRQPGALCDALNVIKQQSINLTKIDSRPSGQRSWHYVFFLEMTGHHDDVPVQKALENLKEFCLDIKVLGSYPSELNK